MSNADRPAPSAGRSMPVIVVHQVTKTYGAGEVAVQALRGVSLAIERGELVAIMGASGSGKSTLMHILGALDLPTSGRFLLDGVDVSTLDDDQLAEVRNRQIGYVFQSFNLVPRTSALANVELPLVYARMDRAERRRRALAALEVVGLAARADHLPSQLSGGEQQRVAVARAIATEPAIVLADEPTGNLDSTATGEVLEAFERLHASGRTVVLITHEADVAAHAERVIRLLDGRIVSDDRRAGAHVAPGGSTSVESTA